MGVVIEATYNWYWLVDELIEDGYRVHLANPAAIRQYEGLKYSGDFTDAAHLAQLLRLGLLPEGYIYPAQGRQVRDLSRMRMQLVQCRTAQIFAIENLFSRHTGGQMRGERVKRLDVQSGVDINTIRAWLGHVSLTTTNVYAEINLDTKARALATCEVFGTTKARKRWRDQPDLMEFLHRL